MYTLIVELYKEQKKPDYLTVCRILISLDDANDTAATLVRLLNGSEVRSTDLGTQSNGSFRMILCLPTKLHLI